MQGSACLYGEACGIPRAIGIRPSTALSRAREYFARKGDQRMQALACLKLSSILIYWGKPDLAFDVADAGIELAPADAIATRLRLEGNIAITRTWQTQSADEVVAECERIAIEAERRDLEHIAAIAHHNAGELLLRMGRVQEAIASLGARGGSPERSADESIRRQLRAVKV